MPVSTAHMKFQEDMCAELQELRDAIEEYVQAIKMTSNVTSEDVALCAEQSLLMLRLARSSMQATVQTQYRFRRDLELGRLP